MRLWVLLTAAALLAVAGCSPGDGGPRPGPSMHIQAPGGYIEPPAAVRPAPAPIGVGLPGVGRVTGPPPRRCKIKEKTVVQNGRKRVTRYQVCK